MGEADGEALCERECVPEGLREGEPLCERENVGEADPEAQREGERVKEGDDVGVREIKVAVEVAERPGELEARADALVDREREGEPLFDTVGEVVGEAETESEDA